MKCQFVDPMGHRCQAHAVKGGTHCYTHGQGVRRGPGSGRIARISDQEIRHRHACGATHAELAQVAGVCRARIQQICHRRACADPA